MSTDLIIYKARDAGLVFTILEVPPLIRTVQAFNKYYRISWPYLIFFIHSYSESSYGLGRLFFSKEKLKSIHDPIFTTKRPFPHRNRDGSLCFYPVLYTSNHERAMLSIVDQFWKQEIVYTVSDRSMSDRIAEAKKLLEYWANLTKKDPFFWKTSGELVAQGSLEACLERSWNIEKRNLKIDHNSLDE